jgi:beta-glucosidase
MKLGMFDPKEKVPYNKLSINDVDTKEHREMALKVAQKSIVLLKNDGILPLSKDIKSIAVLGPNAVREEILYGNYSGCSVHPVLPLDGLKNKMPNAEITYIQGCNYYDKNPVMAVIPDDVFQADGQQGIRKEVFDTAIITGDPAVTTTEKNINYHWGFGGMKAPKEIKHYDYVVRWSGIIVPKETSGYMFSLNGNYVMRLYLNDKLIAEKNNETNVENSKMISLKARENYVFRMEYECKKEWAAVQLMWGKENKLSYKESAQLAAKSDAIVMFAGLSPSLEGEEMKVKVDGFNGGDRTSISLPKAQEEMLKALKETGKPVVLVLINGSALAVNFAQQNINAILEAWYPGEEGGNAIADVLFGDYNPSGRLPVTFYKSEKDLPDFKDYNMKGRTYRYFEGTPLYPFGYGLSYTTFKYSNLVIPASAKTGENVTVKVDVENTGKMDGDEVAELYVKIKDAKVPVPIHSLQGFKRIYLKQGEKQTLEFILKPKQFLQISNDFKRVVVPGNFDIFVGGCQPGKAEIKSGIVLQGSIELSGDIYKVD